MKKILILLCGCLLLFTGIARSQSWYLNMPDTVCMSTNSGSADQIKFTSMNVQLASNAASKANWSISTPNNTKADYNILYSERTSSIKDTLLNQTNLLTLQFLTAGKYTFTIAMTYKTTSGGKTTYSTVTKTQSIVVLDCTISTCSGGDAEMPGFTENFGTLPANTTRMAYTPSSAITYIYTPSGDPADNYYAISNTTHLKGDWITTNDHTGTTRGGMLVANSGFTKSTFFQKQVDGLCRGSVYNFSAWFINADSSLVMTNTCASGFIYAGVTFQILNAANTNQILASFRTYAVSPNFAKATWQRFGGSFTVPSGVSSVIVRIVNNFPGGCGNDIAVDDIQFSYCSPIITAGISGSTSTLKEVLCEGVATTLTSSYTPTNYFTSPAYQWEMSDDQGVTWFDVPYGTANSSTLVISDGELKGTKDVSYDYLFRVRIFEAGSSSATCAAPSSSVKITILPMPALNLTKAQVCEGDAVILQASGGYDYFNWSDLPKTDHSTDRSIVVTSDTTIKVYGYITYSTENKVCVDSNQAFIGKDDKPIVEIAATDTALCLGSRTFISIADNLAPTPANGNSIRWYRGTSVATGTLVTDYNDMTSFSLSTETLADSAWIVVVTSKTCTVTSKPLKIHLTEVPIPDPGKHVTRCVEDGTVADGKFTMSRPTIPNTKSYWTVIGVTGPGIAADPDPEIDFDNYVHFVTSRSSASPVIDVLVPGTTVYLQYRIQASANTSCLAYAYDTLTLINGASRAYAGPDTTLCGTSNTFVMQANEPNIELTDEFAESGAWTIVGGPNADVVIADTTAYNTTVKITNGKYQDVSLIWTIRNASSCGTNSDTVVLHYTAAPTMVLKPDTVCNTLGYFEMDTVSTSGNPTYYSVTGTMPGFTAVPETEITSWPITVPIPTGVTNSAYTFTVNFRSNNGGCTASTTIRVNVETPPTAPTSVTVGSPNICTSGTTTLTAVGGALGKNADGTNAGRYVWYAGGCGSGTSIGTGATITVPVTATTTYYVRVESNGQCGVTACASGTVTVYTAPTASNAGPAQTHCNDSLFIMAANAASVGAGKWTVTSGTATIPTTDSALTTAKIYVLAGKTATLTWTITNGACTTSSSVVLTNYMKPVAAAVTNAVIEQCANTSFTVSGVAPSPATATGSWSKFTGSKATITGSTTTNTTAVTLPVGDTATLIWTVTNGTCSSSAYVKLYNYATPTTSNAGVDTIKQCNTAAFTMAATAPTVGVGKWSVKSGTATFVIADSTNTNAVINVPVGTTAVMTWTVKNGTCSSTDDIVLINYQQPGTANAGPDSLVQCNNASFTMSATAATPATAVGKWSLFTGSKASFPLADSNKINVVFTLAAGDTATAIWTVTNGVCSSTDYIFLKNYKQPTTANAGPAQYHCNNSSFTMAANAASVGVGTWTVSKPTASIANPNSPTTTITVPAGDSVIATWTIVNGLCNTSSTVKLVNYATPTKAVAGTAIYQCANPNFTMAANTATVGVGTWTKPAGSTATFTGNINTPNVTVTLPTGDSTKLYWTITNGICSSVDSVWIVNNLAPAAADAGPDTIKHCNSAPFVMSANAPSVAGATGYWSVVSPAAYTITSAQLNNPTATFNVNAGQTVVLKWNISNIGCSSSDNIVLVNYVQPTATSAGSNQTHCNDSIFTVTGSAPMTGATGTWYIRSNNATFVSQSGNTATVKVPAGQTATLRWVITNGVCADSSTVTLLNNMQPVAADAGPAYIEQCATNLFTMSAVAASPSTATGTWSTFTGSKATITAGQNNLTNATFTMLPGDTATLIWTVTNGTCSSSDYIKLYNYATPTTANAGVDTIKQCNTAAFTMAATAPTVGVGKWSVKSGTATFVIADSTKTNAVINVPVGTTAIMTWTVKNGTCSSTDDIVLINYQQPGTANAGPDSLVQCNNASFTMSATAATPATAVGKWSLFTGSKASFPLADSNKINVVFTLAAGDTATAIWTVTNGVCSSTDYIFLKNYKQPTTANAGPAQYHCNNSSFTMAANAASVGVGTWTVSKPTASIANPNSPTTTITVPAGDSVIATWTIVNGLCNTSSTVKLVNYATPTKAVAGTAIYQCANPNFTMAANTATVGVGTWTKPAGSTATFTGNINTPNVTVTLPTGDSTKLYWTITNGICSSVDSVWIVNNLAPAAADAGPDTIKHCNNAPFVMSANAPSVAGATGYWSVVSPAAYTITSAQLNNPTATFNVTAGQTVVLKWNISNIGCSSSDNIVLVNYVQPTATSAGSNQTHCNDSIFTVTGSAPMTGATGTWYIRSNNATFVSQSGNTATVKVPAGQTATLRWVITNGVCADSSTVTLLNNMQPVAADAGPAYIEQCATNLFTMSAVAASPSTATGTWSTFTGSKATITAGQNNLTNATFTMLPGDTATLIWTVTNGTCSSSDYIKLYNYATPTTANAGVDTIKQCNTAAFTMAATAPTVGVGKWSVKSGTATFVIADSTKTNAVITVPVGTTAVMTWTVKNGTCSSTDDIVLINYQQPGTANAGPDSLVQCNNPVFTMSATAATPATAVGKWSLFTGSKATHTLADSSKTNIVFTLAAGDTATAIWTVTNGVCSSTDYIFLKNYQQPTTANAGPAQYHCADPIFTTAANTASVGVGTWTLSNTRASITGNVNSPVTTINVPAGDSVIATWTIVNGLCNTSSNVKLVNYATPTKALAGTAIYQCANPNFTMAANTATVGVGTWTKPAGSTATFTGNINTPNVTVTLPTGDSTKLYWTITNGICSSVDSVWIVNNLAPAAADAGPDTIKHCNSAPFVMSANAPSVAGATGWWSVVSPAAYTITSAQLNNPTATFNVTAGQTVVLKWNISNIGCSSSDNIVLVNYVQPTATSAGSNQTHCNDSIFTVTGSAPMTGATGTWYIRSNNATFVSQSGNTATVKVPAGQTATLRWVITNGVCADSSTVTLLNNMQPVAADAGPAYIEQCANPTFTLNAVAPSPSTATGTWSTFTGSKATITGSTTTATTTVTMAAGDTATLIWTVTNGTCSSSDYIKLYNYATPTTANAGVDTIKQCNTAAFTMAATAPTVGVGKWSVKSGTATFATTDSTSISAVITVPVGTTAVMTWTVKNGTCSSTDDIVLINYQQPGTANAGPDSLVQCNNPVFTMSATAPTPATAVGKWSLFTGSKATYTLADSSKTNIVFNLAAGDTATAIWTVTNGVCSSTDYIFLKNYQQPTTANAGPAQYHCADPIFTTAANTASVGVGTWTLSNTRASITGNVNVPVTTINVPAGDSVIATWTIVNGLCNTSSTVKLVNYIKPDDAEAGPDQHQCNNPSFTLTGNTPSVSTASGMWSKPAGSTATFTGSLTSASTTVTIPVGDSSKLYWTITNGVCTTVDSVWIVNNNPPAPANAGPDTIKHCDDATFVMAANAPSVAGATGWWTAVSPAAYPITPAQLNDPAATFTVTAGQTVVLKWNISNLGCSSSDNIVLVNYEQPTAVTAGPDQTKCAGSAFVLDGSVPNVAGAIGTWYVRNGVATIATGEEHLPKAHITLPNDASAELHWVVSNGTCADSASVILTNYLTPVKADAGVDSIKHCNDSTFVMNANEPDVTGAVGEWTYLNPTTVPLPADPSDPKATFIIPAGDSVIAVWTIGNGTCSTSDQIKLVNYMAPTAAAVPADMQQCMTSTFPVTANAPDVPGAIGYWTVVKGNATFPTTDSSKNSTTFTVPNGDSAYVTWTLTNGICISSATIKLYNYQQPAQADAGADSLVQCNNPAFNMAAIAPNLATAVGKWSLYPGSKASFSATDSTNINAVFNLPAGDTATAFWTVTNGVCSSYDKIMLKNYEAPAQADAGPDSLKHCNDPVFTMSATAPNLTSAYGKWTLSNPNATIAAADTSNINAVINVPAGDSVIATWTVTNGACATSDVIKLVNYQQPTAAAAGSDTHQCATPKFTMAANTPDVAGAIGTWTLPAASASTMPLADIHKPNIEITVPEGDSVIATWTITNGVCTSSSTVKLVNDRMPTPANAGTAQTHCADSAFVMTANAASIGTGTWSFYPGSKATIAATDVNTPTAKIFVPAGDTATAIWTITNNSCATSSTVFLKNDMMPETANAGANQVHCNDSAFVMNATAGLLPGSTGKWTVISGIAYIANADLNNPNAKVLVYVNTSATLQWTLSNGTCTGTPATVTLTNLGPVMGNTITADQTVCGTETPAALKGTTTLSGGDGTFSYQWQMSTTSATTGFINVTTGTGGTAASYTPATLTADTVWFRRIVTSGACSTTLSNAVKIRRVTTPPVVVSVPAAITTDCVLGKDYTTMFGTPVFSHAPFNNEALTVTYTDNTTTPDACHTVISRTWTAVDRCGLTTTAQQTITVVDTKAPVFTTAAPADVTVECDKVPAAVNLTANDACVGLLTIAPIETRIDMPGQCTSNYYLIRKWVAVDNCGNASDTLKQTITVRDLTGPVFTGIAPANITVDCDKVPAAAPLTATDNCTPGVITVNPVDTRQAISGAKCSNTYQLTRTWTASDNCGNTTILRQVITVQDTTRPAFSMTLVADTTVNCDAVPDIPTITATDNCSANVSVKVSQTKVFLSTTCSNNYRLTRTWTASDDCGNTATMKQVITVQDTTKPVFKVAPPRDTTVSCSAVPTPPTNISAIDNCTATSNVKVSYSQTRQSITGSCAGNYQLIRVWTAKDECGNTNIVRQIITVVDTTKPVIDPAPAAVTVTCGGTIPAAATLYATDNCDANFPKKATLTTDPYTVDACNGYTITRRWNVTDACGNAAIERVQIITVAACPKPALDANLPVNCSDNTKFSIQLLTKVSKPTFTLQSVYPAGAVTTPKVQTSNVFDLPGVTQATFIVTDGVTGCVSDPVTYTLQFVQKPTVDLGADVAICEGNTVTLDAGAANASAGYAIKWSTGATTQQITVSAAGTYSVTVTNNGCSATGSVKVTVNKPPVVELKDATICDGETIKLNAYVQGASYAWSTGDTGPSIEVSTAGTYSVDVSLNGCTVSAQATITVSTPPNVTVTPDPSVCPGETVMLQVEPDGGSVKWNDGTLTNSIVVSKPGDYWVTVTKNGCVVTDTLHVTNKANINLDLGPDKDICIGGLVVLDATNPDAISYLWNDGTTDPVREVSTPGTYTVTVLDKNCNLTSTASVKVTVAGIGDISLGNDTTICIGQTLTLNVDAGTGNSVRWQDGTTTSKYVVTQTGYYKVTVYNDCGSVTDDITVTYKQCEAKPDFPNAFTPNGDGNNDTFKPHVNGPMYDYDLRVFNRWGQVVFLSKDQTKGWDGRFQGTLVDVGTYVYLLSYKNAAGGETRIVKGEVSVIR